MFREDAIVLHRITRKDLPVLLEWRNSDDFARYCSKRRATLTEADFDNELRNDFARDRHCQVLISGRRSGKPIGTMYSYGYSAEDGHLFVTIFVEESRRNRGLGAIAFAQFCRALFDLPGLYKIYVDVYEHNVKVIGQLRRAGLVEEGRFKGHRKEGDVRYDALRFALFRETLDRSFLAHRRSS